MNENPSNVGGGAHLPPPTWPPPSGVRLCCARVARGPRGAEALARQCAAGRAPCGAPALSGGAPGAPPPAPGHVSPVITMETPWDVELELRQHIQTCACTCNHMGYGNYMDYQVRRGSRKTTCWPCGFFVVVFRVWSYEDFLIWCVGWCFFDWLEFRFWFFFCVLTQNLNMDWVSCECFSFRFCFQVC